MRSAPSSSVRKFTYVPPVEWGRRSRQAARAHSMFVASSSGFSHDAVILERHAEAAEIDRPRGGRSIDLPPRGRSTYARGVASFISQLALPDPDATSEERVRERAVVLHPHLAHAV